MEMRFHKQRQMAHVDRYKQKLETVPVSNTSHITVLSTGGNGLGRSFVLKTCTDRYLFNCGETVQKALPDISLRVGPIDNIFFTYNTWNNVGGIMGFLLTNSTDILHAKTIVLHGPPNVDKVLENTRMFSDNHHGQLAKVVWRGIDKVKHEDEQLTVEYVELRSSGSLMASGQEMSCKPSEKETSPSGSQERNDPEIGFYEADSRLRRNGSDIILKKEEGFETMKPVMAYIIKFKPLPRRVDPDKLLALNAKSGPWIKKVVNGETVTLPDGRTVNPDKLLLTHNEDLCPILVLDCPTEDYLDSLMTSQQILDLSSADSCKPHMIIHMAPVSVTEDQRYKQLMDRFDSKTIHLMLNENSPGPYVHASQSHQSILHHIHPEIFPLLQGSIDYCTKPARQTGNIIQGFYGMCYNIRPKKKQGFDWDGLVYFDQEAKFKEVKKKAVLESTLLMRTMSNSEDAFLLGSFQEKYIDDEIRSLRSKIMIQELDSVLTDEYPEMVFLGTGSAKPALHRNSSAILIQMRKDEYLLMDCGEGTLVQMYQMYGLEKTHHIISNLKGVFISHLHYDHHGGLFGILEARSKAVSQNEGIDRLTIFAPTPMKKWFYLYSRCVSQIDLKVEFIPLHILSEAVKTGNDSNYLTLAKNVLGVSEFVVMPVIHTGNSFGISIMHQDGWKLVYSGDTMPCQNLIRYGKDCDILIHEATFDDQAVEDALFKKHSTTSQAIDVGRKMGAKFILLTHFSQRFSKIPDFIKDFTENVGFTFDFMQLRPSQLKLIPQFKPVLSLMFGAELQNRMTKQRRKRTEVSSSEKEALIEELRSEKEKADEQFVKNKKLDMKVWSCIGEELKAKLKDLQNKAKMNGKNVTDSNIKTSSECAGEKSTKRKVSSDSVGKKIRKTDPGYECIPSTSEDTEEDTGIPSTSEGLEEDTGILSTSEGLEEDTSIPSTSEGLEEDTGILSTSEDIEEDTGIPSTSEDIEKDTGIPSTSEGIEEDTGNTEEEPVSRVGVN